MAVFTGARPIQQAAVSSSHTSERSLILLPNVFVYMKADVSECTILFVSLYRPDSGLYLAVNLWLADTETAEIAALKVTETPKGN